VILRAVRDFWALRVRLWLSPAGALGRGGPILASVPGREPGGPAG
jgi:hypothetical protein